MRYSRLPPLEGGLRSDDSDECQTPSEGMTELSSSVEGGGPY